LWAPFLAKETHGMGKGFLDTVFYTIFGEEQRDVGTQLFQAFPWGQVGLTSGVVLFRT